MKLVQLKNYKNHPIKISKSVADILEVFPQIILAGGAIRDSLKGREIQDYDLFFTDLGKSTRVKEILLEKGFKLVFACPQGLLYTLIHETDGKVQLICKRSYSSIEDCFMSFDFTICQFALKADGTILCTREAIRDNKKMMLTLHNLEYPTATINRLAKYKNKGFFTGHAVKDIVKWLVNMSPEHYDTDNDALYID